MKNTIHIDIYMSEVIYDINNTTHHKGESVDSIENHKTASDIQLDSMDADSNLVHRCVGNAYAELKSRLSEYVNENGTTANNKLFDEDSNVSVVLYVPTNFNLAVKDSIASSMHQFMVATSIREWYTITSKEDAKDYRLTGDEAIKLIIANINKRLRLTRGTLPNYANDIKGGTFDAESNSIVFTNDLQKELFRITLPTDGTITNGYYDAETGLVHLTNPRQQDVFTLDLSPLKNAAKDYSLQSIVIENGNIVFKFKNDKSDITVPISSIVTLPDMSDYYTKDEVDEMFEDFTPGGGGTEQVQSDWGQTDTTAKDYIKNKPDAYTKSEINTMLQEYKTNDEAEYEMGELRDAIPNVPSWAMQSTKPSYTAQEVGALPSSTQIPTVSNATIALQVNGEGIGNFTLNQSENASINLSGLEKRLQIVKNPTLDNDDLVAQFGRYYVLDNLEDTVTINLPETSSSATVITGLIIYAELPSDGNGGLLFAVDDNEDIVESGLSDIEEGKTYEFNCIWNGTVWAITAIELKAYTQS